MKKLTAKQEWALEQIKQLQYSENLSAAAVVPMPSASWQK